MTTFDPSSDLSFGSIVFIVPPNNMFNISVSRMSSQR